MWYLSGKCMRLDGLEPTWKYHSGQQVTSHSCVSFWQDLVLCVSSSSGLTFSQVKILLSKTLFSLLQQKVLDASS